jgi:actin-related protein
MEQEDVEVLVIDNGTQYIKAGTAGRDAPRAVFPTVIGDRRAKQFSVMMCMGAFKTRFIGDEALMKRGILNLTHPIERGVISNWDNMEAIWHHTFYNELRRAPEEHPTLITESPLQSKKDREKATQIMFETFCIPSLLIANTAELALHSSGRTTGIVLQSGEDITHAVPIYEGHAMPEATCTMQLGGKHITEYLAKLLVRDHEIVLTTSVEMDIVRDIKEKRCFVASDRNKDLTNYSYEIPERTTIQLGETRFECTEPLFNPKLVGVNSFGIHEIVHHAIRKCDPSIRNKMYSNIVLAGGNTMFYGFAERLTLELEKLAPGSTRVNVIAAPERKYSTWIGGSIKGTSYDTINWITKEMYDEYGPEIVHIVCPQTSFQAEALSSPKITYNHIFTDVDLFWC